MRGAFETAGDIRSVDLLAALVALWRAKESGSLRFFRTGATAGFDLVDGEVTSSSSSQSQFDTTAILVRAGKLDAASLERLEKGEETDSATAALQAGLVSRREWKWGQKIRAIEILSDVLGWLEGRYEYDAAVRPSAADWTLPIPRLVLELFLRSRDRTLVEHSLGPSDLPLLRSEEFDAEFETFGLTADAGSVIRLIDGRATAEEIAEKAPADEFAVLKLLAALTTLGLVHPAEAASAPPRSRAARPRKQKREESGEPPIPKLLAEPKTEPVAGLPTAPESEERPPALPSEKPADGEPPPEPPPVLITGPSPEPPQERLPEQELPEQIEPLPPPVLPFEPSGVPADLVPEPFEAAVRKEEEAPGPDFRLSSGPPGSPDRPLRAGGSGFLLAGLLAALVLAVTVIIIARSRGRVPPGLSATPGAEPIASENPVFPSVETAVPLPNRGREAQPASAPIETPTPMASPTLPPTPASTHPPATNPPAAALTRPVPSRTFTATPTRPTATRTPTPAPTRPAPTKSPMRSVSEPPAPTMRPPPTLSGREAPTRAPLPVPTAAAPAEGTREDWLRRAERERRSLSKRRDIRYAIQLELACEVPTLERAWTWDKPPGTMWLLTSTYRGRTCFRVLWGRYGTLGQAKAAKPRIPGFFVAPGNQPAIVSVR